MSKRAFGAALLVCVSATATNAASLEFARGAVLDLRDDGQPAYRVSVPEDVYLWTTRDDLGDLRVLDGAGNELPYAVRFPPGGDSVTEWSQLPTFALPAASAAKGSTAV